MNKLDITKLIQKGEEIINDPQLGFAAEIEYEVQNIKANNGDKYILKLVAEYVKPEKK